MKKTDVIDLLFMPKEEFHKLDGEFIDQMPAKQIARIPFYLWNTMTKEQIKHISASALSTLDYDELVKLYIKYSGDREPYTFEYKVKDKAITVQSNGLEEKIYETILQEKKRCKFKARDRIHKNECMNGIIFTNADALYNYLPKPSKEYYSWTENKEKVYTTTKLKNDNGTKDTKYYFDFDDIQDLLRVARRDGEDILNDEIPPLFPFTDLMNRYKVKYTLTSQFNNRWKIPYYLLFCGQEVNDASEGTRYYDIVECEPILEKILQIEFSPTKIHKYKDTNIIPIYCLEKVYPFLNNIDELINEGKIDLYRGIENLLDYNSVIDYIQTLKINKINKKPRDLPFLLDFYDYFKDLNLSNELLEELKNNLNTYIVNDKVLLEFPLERRHKKGGAYDNFRLKIISIIKDYVVYKFKLNDTKNTFHITNKIPDIFVECLISELVLDYPDLKNLYISNIKEFYPVNRLDGLGYGDIGYMDYDKITKYFNL